MRKTSNLGVAYPEQYTLMKGLLTQMSVQNNNGVTVQDVGNKTKVANAVFDSFNREEVYSFMQRLTEMYQKRIKDLIAQKQNLEEELTLAKNSRPTGAASYLPGESPSEIIDKYEVEMGRLAQSYQSRIDSLSKENARLENDLQKAVREKSSANQEDVKKLVMSYDSLRGEMDKVTVECRRILEEKKRMEQDLIKVKNERDALIYEKNNARVAAPVNAQLQRQAEYYKNMYNTVKAEKDELEMKASQARYTYEPPVQHYQQDVPPQPRFDEDYINVMRENEELKRNLAEQRQRSSYPQGHTVRRVKQKGSRNAKFQENQTRSR